MPHLWAHLISRKLFAANLLPKWASEYTSKVGNLALFVMAIKSWRETTQIRVKGLRSSMPLINAPNYLFVALLFNCVCYNCMLKFVLKKLCSQI